MSDGFEGSCQRTELTTTDRQEPCASLNEANPARSRQLIHQARLQQPSVEDEWGFNLVRYRIAPRSAPTWAVLNWREAIRTCKRSGCTAETIRALTHQKVDDLHCIVEALTTSPPHLARSVKSAWKSYHRTWVDDQVHRIESDTQPAGRGDPYSLRSIKAALCPADQRTWEALRKLMSRKSRGTGKRNRKPSKEKRAFEGWTAVEKQFERLLRLLIIDGEPIRYVERECNLAEGDAVKMISPALMSLRGTIGSSKLLKGPRQVSQEIVRNGHLYPGPEHHKERNHTEVPIGQ